MLQFNQTAVSCRRVAMPACEPEVDTSPTAPIPALKLFQMRSRDILDFGIDFAAWLQANGSAVLATATWAVASNSPQTPATVTTVPFDPAGMTAVLVEADAVGDAYYLECTITTAPTQPSANGALALPARTVVRRIHILVVNG